MKPSGSIAWYVSSHGWGHASRQREVIREIVSRHPGVAATVITDSPGWLWPSTSRAVTDRRATGPVPIESGASIDLEATARQLDSFSKRWTRLVRREAEFLSASGAGLVVSDIDAVPFEAAWSVGIPSVGIANFTWDWAFSSLLGLPCEACGLMSSMYSHGTLLRLPLGPSWQPFGACVDVPLLSAGIPRDPSRAREVFGSRPVLLVTLRDASRLEGRRLTPPEGWLVASSLLEEVPGVGLNLPPARLDDLGLGFADLVEAADAVLMTPGYGIVSQVLARGKRAVVLPRPGFPEVPYLMASLDGRPGTVVREARGLSGSGLGKAVMEALEGPDPVPVPSGGLEACVGFLSSLIDPRRMPGTAFREPDRRRSVDFEA